MPRPPQHAAPELYSEFISLISATPPHTLELDILPSCYPPEIHSDTPSVALPKPLLASLFLTARRIFLSYLSLERNVYDQDEDNDDDQAPSETKALCSDPPSYSAALDSTMVILLWDPNHLTAANFRKKNLLSLRICPSPSPKNNSILLEALAAEFHYLTSLLTSPLPKHNKSSTLWSHRLFLLRTFGAEILHIHSLTGASTNAMSPLPVPSSFRHPTHQLHFSTATLWNRELSTVLTAGGRHPRNFYAWNYARELLDILASHDDASSEAERKAPNSPRMEIRECLVEDSVAEVRKWCFGHPRDISGWAFLAFLLREMRHDGTSPSTSTSATAAMDNGSSMGAERVETATAKEDAARTVVEETKDFVRKFGWKGASVEWFLKAMGE